MDRPVNIFEKMGSLIPGYPGYAERNNRRQCDRLLRDSVVSSLIASEKKLTEKISALITSGDGTHLMEVEATRKRVNTIRDKIRYAPYGESGFFSCAQLKEEELFSIYEKDLALLDKANEIHRGISGEDAHSALQSLTELEGMLTARNEYIREFK
jgi:hypothetical protein